ncbi:MAG: tRNA (adenosine(37)-N6)-threonylcarbamoyltransferase complex dimerization subunit type 1 TsaB [Limisphaera sp.]
MKMLALDFSGEPRGVALLEGTPPEMWEVRAEMEQRGGRSVPALAMVGRVLEETGWDRSEVEAIAVGLGPGSYTGIRAALALAQGWFLARGVAVYGANSMDSVAARAWGGGLRGRVRVVVDAQRRELYVAGYELRQEGWSRVEPLRLEAVERLQQANDRADWIWVGPEVDRWFSEGRLMGPSAVEVGRLAAREAPRRPEAWEPIYLRPVQFVKAQPVVGGTVVTSEGVS